MTIAAKFRERMHATGLAPFNQAILTVAMDDHSVHCMTEDMLDEWFRSLEPEEKADLFDAHLGAPDLSLPRDRNAGTGLLGLNAITVGLPTLGAPAQGHGEAHDLRRPNQGPALRTLLAQSIEQFDQISASHLPSLALAPVEVLR